MKRFLIILLTLLLILSISACHKDTKDPEPGEPDNSGATMPDGEDDGFFIRDPSLPSSSGTDPADGELLTDGNYGSAYDGEMVVQQICTTWSSVYGDAEITASGDEWATYVLQAVDGEDNVYYPAIAFSQYSKAFNNASLGVYRNGYVLFSWSEGPDDPVVYFEGSIRHEQMSQYAHITDAPETYSSGSTRILIYPWAVHGTFSYTYNDGAVMLFDFDCYTEDVDYAMRIVDEVAAQYGIESPSTVIVAGNKEVT